MSETNERNEAAGDWSHLSPAEVVRRTRCEADNWNAAGTAVPWRACCDLILKRLAASQPAPLEGVERGDLGELERLSAAATPGPWRHIVGDDYFIESDSYPPKATHNPSVVDSGWWLAVGNRPDDFGEANSQFIVALVNAFRAGHLVPASPAPALDHGEGGGWLPIESAPRDGTAFLAYWLRLHTDGTRYEAAQPYVVARYERERLYPSWIGEDTPTHWMPLPAPPTVGSVDAPAPSPLAQARAVLKWLDLNWDETPAQHVEWLRTLGRNDRADAIEAALRVLAAQDQDGEVRNV